MKVIDLLNKIANGEEAKPIDYKGEKGLTYYLYDKCGRECDDTNLVNILNDEVEVIEEEPRDIEMCGSFFTRSEYNKIVGIKEDKKIEKMNEFIHCDSLDYRTCNRMFEEITEKVNEIIDKIGE